MERLKKKADSNEEGNDKAARPGLPSLRLPPVRAHQHLSSSPGLRAGLKWANVNAALQKSLVMVVEENEQEEDEDGDVEEAREREQERGERRGAV
ncbi:hypothetical protein G5I_03304 [Acromyrmex echinatior]|uniref:Uncharacterized protein n=1 Tax=Acromyrmex echinatior TaxID=103372 RepID=F4WCM8_ACREC|nr:hypothetical protein G5I_03304 [Acromyrmex echinatior]